MPSMKKDLVGFRFEWERVRLEVMEVLGRNVEAQAFRWQCFERTLSIFPLRTYLKRLPEFEDLEAEERATLSRSQIFECPSGIGVFGVLARFRKGGDARDQACK